MNLYRSCWPTKADAKIFFQMFYKPNVQKLSQICFPLKTRELFEQFKTNNVVLQKQQLFPCEQALKFKTRKIFIT